jgi:succinyl-diaminopimelate desuccinylase
VQTIDGLKTIVEGILKKHGVRYTLEWYVSGEPFYTAPGALSAGVTRAIETETGAKPKFSTGGGTSDGRFIATLGSQVVECGVINATIHKVNESVNVTDIDRLHRIYLNALKEMLA